MIISSQLVQSCHLDFKTKSDVSKNIANIKIFLSQIDEQEVYDTIMLIWLVFLTR